MSTLASITDRLSGGLAELWQGASNLLYGQEDQNHRQAGRGRRSRSRSRNRRHGSSSVIPPPHMSRRFESVEIQPSVSFPSSALPPARIFMPVEQGRFSMDNCQNTFAYALLGSSSLQNSPRLDPINTRNVFAALCSILVIAVMATALAQPRWISINSRGNSNCPKTVFLGVQEFIYITTTNQRSQSEIPYLPGLMPSDFKHRNDSELPADSTENPSNITDATVAAVADGQSNLLMAEAPMPAESHSSSTNSSTSSTEKLDVLPKPSALGHPAALPPTASDPKCNFITEDIVSLQRLVIFFCALSILSNLGQFILDTLGTGKPWLNRMRSNAVGSIFGVILTIIIIFLTFVVSSLLEKGSAEEHVEIRFEFSYYLVTLAGLIGLIAASCNLLRRPTYFTAIEIPEYPELMSTPLDDRWRDDSTAYMPPPAYTP